MSNLLKQAIADAKAVRATALSNARTALEEHFAPKLQSMLSEKLKAEMAEEEGAEGSEDSLPVAGVNVNVEEPEVAPEAAPEAAAEAPIGSDDSEAPIDGEAPVEEPAVNPVPAHEGEDFGDEFVEEDTNSSPGTKAAGNVYPGYEGLTEELEKASPDYKKTTSGHKTDNKGQEIVKATSLKTSGGPKEAPAERTASPDYKKDAPDKNQVKDKSNKAPKTDDPQGPSDELSKGLKKDDKGTSALQENEEEVDDASLDEILKELENSVRDCPAGEEAAQDHEEELNLDELLSEEADEDKKDDEKEEDDDKDSKKPEWLKENISLKKELKEYRSAVVYLRDRINEVNLLNAKLLYTNKLFKQASLTNGQKLKVIESFDLTKSVREAKLVYATLAESFNFGGKKDVAPAKKPMSSTVKSITEGLASKSIASTKPTKTAVLTEGAEMANRFKKLAGIRK